MPKLTNVMCRIDATVEVKTPFSGTVRDLLPCDDRSDYVVMLVGMRPGKEVEGDELRLLVNSAVQFVAPVSWLMDFSRLNGELYAPQSNGALIDEVLQSTAELSRLVLDAWKRDAEPPARIGALGKALAHMGNGISALQAIAGVRIARAVRVGPRDTLHVQTEGAYRVYLSGLLAMEAE